MRSHVRREREQLAAPGSSSCSAPARPPSRPSFAAAQGPRGDDFSWTAMMTVAIMFQTGGHAQCLWTAKARHEHY